MNKLLLKPVVPCSQFIFLLLVFSFVHFQSQSQVVVYTDCNFRGAQSRLSPGTYNNSYQINLPDRSISSIQIPRGYLVELYSGPNLTGNTGTYSGTVSCLSSAWNNQVRSLRVIQDNGGWPGGGGSNMNSAGLFTDCDYRGRNGYLPSGDYPSLRNIIGNNSLASLRVPQGMYIELYSEENYRGTSTGKIFQDQRCLGSFWYRRASSARVRFINDGWAPPPPPVYPPAPNTMPITIYSFCNYLGLPIRFEQGEVVSLREAMGGRPLGSMMIPIGMTVELYSQPYMRGSLIGRFTSNLSCIQGFASFAESMRIYPSGPFGGTSTTSNVWLYTGCQFSGRQVQLNVGRYANLQSGSLLSPSSIRVPRGYEVILYTDFNFRGTAIKLTSDNLCLGSWIRGTARSMIIQRVYNPYGPRAAATDGGNEELDE